MINLYFMSSTTFIRMIGSMTIWGMTKMMMFKNWIAEGVFVKLAKLPCRRTLKATASPKVPTWRELHKS